jgi:hypothetical protein
MPSRFATLKAVRRQPGVFRCSLCNEQFSRQSDASVIQQFTAHLRKQHADDPFLSRPKQSVFPKKS